MEDGFPWRLCEYSHGPVHVSTHLQVLLNNQALSAAFSRLHRKDLDELVKSLIKAHLLISEKLFFKLFYVCLSLEKLVNGKHFLVKKNLARFSGKCFLFILGGKYFPKVVKNLEKSYYLLIISNLVLKLLIAIYILF